MMGLRERDQLHRWVENGRLGVEQWQQLERLGWHQPDSRQWRNLLDRLLALAGVLLLAVGLIFFLAWNWDDLHRFAKLGLAVGALTVFTALAVYTTPYSSLQRAMLLGCALTCGALLALIGQTYQTGADIWQLFAAWAVLMLPWALLSRSAACWGLWLLVCNLALLRFFISMPMFQLFWGFGQADGLLMLGLFNLAVLLLFEWLEPYLLCRPARLIQRLAGLLLLAAWTPGGLLGWWESGFAAVLLILLVVCAVGIVGYLYLRRDLPLLALQLFCLIIVGASGLARGLEALDGFMLFNILGGYLLLSSALASIWLHRLYREERG
ncbi:hypothetical protein CK507_14430 [Pseudomonas sp. WN033]|nr:hypothetical protein CK507_14430 [Pseudomonas sp. WN033]